MFRFNLFGLWAKNYQHCLKCSVNDLFLDQLHTFLFQDAVNVINAHLVELESCEPAAIEAMAALPKSQLNKTCETLQEVKIQDTNTTSVSVMLLLMFCSNLKSHGGFLYYRYLFHE